MCRGLKALCIHIQSKHCASVGHRSWSKNKNKNRFGSNAARYIVQQQKAAIPGARFLIRLLRAEIKALSALRSMFCLRQSNSPHVNKNVPCLKHLRRVSVRRTDGARDPTARAGRSEILKIKIKTTTSYIIYARMNAYHLEPHAHMLHLSYNTHRVRYVYFTPSAECARLALFVCICVCYGFLNDRASERVALFM